MDALGVTHIGLTVGAYIMYFYLLLKFLSKQYLYGLLHIANGVYLMGFALGMLWASSAWGSALPLDTKIILSILVPVPFIAESFLKTKNWKLPALGCALILMNYALPLLIGTVHTH